MAGRDINNRDLRQNNTLSNSSILAKVTKPELIQARQEKAISDQQEIEFYLNKYPNLRDGNYSLDYLRQYDKSRSNTTQVDKDTKTEQLHQKGKSDAKDLRDMEEVSLKLDLNLLLSSIPGLYPFLLVGMDLRYSNITGENITPYTAPAVVSSTLEAVAPFIPEGMNYAYLWGRRNFGNRASRVAAVMDLNMLYPTETEFLPYNVGWGPKLTLSVTHKSNSAEPLQLFNTERWDVVNEGANPLGIWWLGKLGIPRTTLTGNTVKLAEKAAKARKLFEERPYTHPGDLTLEKPIVTVGDVPNRSALSYLAELIGADGIIYNNVYDNGYNNNLVILGFTPVNEQLNLIVNAVTSLPTPTGTSSNVNYDFDELLRNGTFTVDPERGYVVYNDVNFDFEEFLKHNPDFKPTVSPYVVETPNGSILKTNSDVFLKKYGVSGNIFDVRANGRIYIPFIGTRNVPNTLNFSNLNNYFNTSVIPKFGKWGVTSFEIGDVMKNAPTPVYYRPVPSNYRNSRGISIRRLPKTNRVGGWTNTDTGETYIDLSSPIPVEQTVLHERGSHVTDKLVPDAVRNRYELFTKEFGNDAMVENSTKWYEGRATRHETEYILRNMGYDTSSWESILKIPDGVVLDVLLNKTNGYGNTYAKNILKLKGEELKKAIQKYKYLLTLPTVAGLLINKESYKQGGRLIPKAKSGIHIKEKNKGKFTKSAKQAGLSVLEHAKSVLNNPNTTPLQKKRANFARNAAKWHKK